MALGMLQTFDLGALPPDSVASQHLQIEAMKLAFADAHRYVSDAATMTVAAAGVARPGYLRERARLIDPSARRTFGPGTPPRGGTIYLCAADAARHDGVADPVELHGLRLRRRRAGHRHQPAEPRRRLLARARPSERSRPAASGRSTRSFPGFVTRNGAPLAAFGVMGGPIQPQGHVQTLVRMVDHAMNPQAALDAPRWKVNAGRSIDLEASASRELREGLIALGHDSNPCPTRTWTSAPGSSSSKSTTATSRRRIRGATARRRDSEPRSVR